MGISVRNGKDKGGKFDPTKLIFGQREPMSEEEIKRKLLAFDEPVLYPTPIEFFEDDEY